MEYYIIDKIELIDSELTYTPVGYLTSQESLEESSDMLNILNNWILLNKDDLENGVISLNNFFETNEYCYTCNTTTTSVDDMGLFEIENINELWL